MTITIDWESAIVHSDTSIVDMVAFHQDLRDAEATTTGILFPSIHTYKEVQLGGGAVFPAIGFVNGWTLQFPVGNYTIGGGNLDCIINPVAGCYVKQTQSAAYAVSSAMGGSTGPTADEIAAAVKMLLMIAPILPVNIKQINDGEITGAGVTGNKWRPV